MLERCGDVLWQRIFVLCQEYQPIVRKAVPPKGPSSGLAPPPRAHQALSAAGFLGPPLEKAAASGPSVPSSQSVKHGLAAASGLEAASGQALPTSRESPPLPPPPDDDDDPEALALRAAAAPSTATPPTFLDYLRGVSAEKLALVTRDYWAFKQAEEEWLAEHPRRKRTAVQKPRKRREQFLLEFRCATGLAYLKWRRTDGSTSKAPLRDRRGPQRETEVRNLP
jgi:hypothetical protein